MNVETIRLLVSKGLSAEDILQVAETLDAPKPRSAAAERQSRYRARKKSDDVTCDVTRDGNSDVTDPLPLPPNENNSNPPASTPVDIPRARKVIDFPKPDWADSQVWNDFIANRKTKRLTNSATAHAKFLNDIERWSADTGWPPGEVLRACVARGWAAIFDPRTGTDERRNTGQPMGRKPGSCETAGREALAIITAQRNRGLGGQDRPALDGGGHGRIIALPPPDRSGGDDPGGPPRMVGGGFARG